MATFDRDAFDKRHEEVKKRDPEWIQFKEEYQHHHGEWDRLTEEVEQLEKQKNEAKDEKEKEEIEKTLVLRSQERELADSKLYKVIYQQNQRSKELERDLLLEEIKKTASDEIKSEIQRLLEEAERRIRYYKELVNKYQREAESAEGQLGHLKKEESQRLREKALKYGFFLMKLFTLLATGSAGVGKTLLKHHLLGLDPPVTRNSTSGAEPPVKIRSISLSTYKKRGSRWMKINAEKLLPIICKFIRLNMKKMKAVVPDDMKELLEQFEVSPSTSTSKGISGGRSDSEGSSPPTMGETSSSLPSKTPISQDDESALKKEIDLLFEKLEKLILAEELSEEDIDELFSSIWVYFTDTGGQPKFHELIPLFINNISSVIFVSRLTDRLDDRPPDEFFVNDKQLGKKCCTHLTTEEQAQCLTRSMLSRDGETKVFVVGTHHDLYLAKKCSETIDEKNKKLIEIFGTDLSKSLVYYKSDGQLIFPVNCLHPEKEDREVAELIQEKVEKLAAKEVKFPIWWFLLELLIQALASKLDKRVLTRKFCLCIANALGFSKKSFDAALDFFNSLNVLKYSPVLPHLVFVDSQVALDNVSDLVEEGYRLSHGLCTGQTGDYLRLCKEGIVTVKFLKDTCKHFEKGLFESAELLKLLESLLAVVPLESFHTDRYFMPALLDMFDQKELEKHRGDSSMAEPLLFTFKNGCRRAGVFCCLIVYVMKECGWSLENIGGELLVVSRNCVRFSLPTCTCIVTLIDAFYYIEAHITESIPSTCLKACPIVRDDVLAGISASCEKMNYTNDQPCLAFFCQHSESTVKGASPRSHELRYAAVYKEADNCCMCMKCNKVTELKEQQKIWLQTNNQATASGQSNATPCRDIQLPQGPVTIRNLSLIKWKDDQGKTQRYFIMDNISHKWRTIGERLDLTSSKLQCIEVDHRGISEECCRAVLCIWLNNPPDEYPISWDGLIELLEDSQLGQVASELRKILNKAINL